MAVRALFNRLELAFAPICNYDFAYIKDDEGFQRHLRDSTLYIVAQRPELTFEALEPFQVDDGQIILQFTIRQKGHLSALNCLLPLYQDAYARNINKEIRFGFQYSLPLPQPISTDFPQSGVRNLLLSYVDQEFIGWLSPENFLQNYLNGAVEARVEGPVHDFLAYQVHYVGKATEQAVWKRLTGHSTLQEILSKQHPFHFGTLPTHELAILFFKVSEPIGLITIKPEDAITSNLAAMIRGDDHPSNRVLSLDAEKALIRAMKPGYNKQFYPNYPGRKSDLSALTLRSYSYQIWSHLILTYTDGLIRGRPDLFADALFVTKGESLQVIRQADALAEFRDQLNERLGKE